MRGLGRRHLTTMSLLMVAVALPQLASAQVVVQVPLDPLTIPQFAQPLPLLGTDIPVVSGKESVDLSMCEFEMGVLPPGTPLAPQANGQAATGKTWVWGYLPSASGGCPALPGRNSYLGPVIVAERGTPTSVTYRNRLGHTSNSKVLAYVGSTDQTLQWADPLGENSSSDANACARDAMMGLPAQGNCLLNYDGPIPAAPHLHGGEIPAALDGGPDAWWTQDGKYGHGYYSTGGTADAKDGMATYVYPNVQAAAPIWFHDHVLGATRLNVYAGLAGAYVITDEEQLPAGLTPTGLGDELIVPLVIQDRMFDTSGQLYFPAIGLNPEHPLWVPEFVGDVIAVNGKAWPYMDVQRKRYRFLVLNGSNARAYELSLIDKATGVKGPDIWVIGNDQGYLDTPVRINPNAPTNNRLVIMPGERYDVIVDFAGAPAGARLLLSNTARTPYPGGAPVRGRTTGRVMEFRVGTARVSDASYDPASGTPIRGAGHRIVRLAGAPVHKTRTLTLNEAMGPGGPLEVLVNNTRYLGEPKLGAHRTDFTPITTKWNTTYYSELPHEGETEIWEIVNITADAHPIHPHLVAFQVLNRQALDVKGYNAAYNGAFPGGLGYVPGDGPPMPYDCGIPGIGERGVVPSSTATCSFGGNPPVAGFLKGAPVPPLPAESGWKDTVIAYPGEVTRVVVRFAPTENPAAAAADTLWYPFNPNTGHGYVWHCHIIDHEDNEMMRPMSVQANRAAPEDRLKLIVPGQDGASWLPPASGQ